MVAASILCLTPTGGGRHGYGIAERLRTGCCEWIFLLGKKNKKQHSEQIGKGPRELWIPELVKPFISFGSNGQQACLM